MIDRRRTYNSGGWCNIHDTKAGDKITHIRYPVDPNSYPDKRYGDNLSDYAEYPPGTTIASSSIYYGSYNAIKIKPLGSGIAYIDVLQRAKRMSAFNIGLYNRNLERLDIQPFSEMVPYTTVTYADGTSNISWNTSETMQAQSVVDENNNWNGAFQIKDGYFIIDLEKYAIAMVRRMALRQGYTFNSQTNTYTDSLGYVYGVAFPTPAEIYNDCSNLGFSNGNYNNYDLWDLVEVYRV